MNVKYIYKCTCRCGRVSIDRSIFDQCDECGLYDHTSEQITSSEMQTPNFWRLVWSS